MKILFKETLQDKHTGAYYYNGTIHEFTEERGKEILASGRAVERVDVAPEATKENIIVTLAREGIGTVIGMPEETEVELVNLESLTVAELKACAKDFGLKTSGTKAQLIERITAFEMAQN